MRLSVVTFFFLLFSCSKPEPGNVSVLILGHGGEGFDDQNTLFAPNSAGSIERAIDFYDLDGVELDIQFTKDRELIVFHDDFLENSTQCKGKVGTLLLDQIEGCLYRKQFHNVYSQQVLSIDSLIELINNEYFHKYFSLNIKVDNDDLAHVDTLAPILAEKLFEINNSTNVAIECSDANFLYFFRQVEKRFKCLLVANINRDNVEDVDRFELDGIVSFFESRNENLEEELYINSKEIYLYGQQTSRHYNQYDYQYITGVQTDNPVLARKFFGLD